MTSSPDHVRQTILIVDDTPENLVILGELLRPSYRVKATSSGSQALRVAQSLPSPDLILLDIVMPEMDGYAVLNQLQKDSATRDIPVIFITSVDTTEDVSYGLELGAVDYITRPIRPPVLLARVRTHLDLKQTRDCLKQQNVNLSRSNTELARAVRARDEFLANMSHELRTPLNVILGLSESLQEEIYGQLNTRQLKSLATIEQSGRHLLSLINDMLDLAKIDAGKVELECELIRVETVCQVSLQFMRQQAIKKRITLRFQVDAALASNQPDGSGTQIYADERRLKQILINLLSNAVKFTPEDGEVGLEVQADPDKQFIRFVVWDTGIGISPEDQQRLFQPFIQVDSSLSKSYGGTGLGLAMVLRLTELHGGRVTLESAIGKGSRFTVVLPRVQLEQATLTDQPDSYQVAAHQDTLAVAKASLNHRSNAPFQSQPILVAEDNEATIYAICHVLEARGYQVIVAHNGVEAITLARKQRPRLILMDIQMPELNGMEAIRHIRTDPALAHVPIIALTALTIHGDRERCLQAGATDYLSKPVGLKTLTQIITRYLM